MIQFIGEDFSQQYKLNLNPGNDLPKGYFQIEITWVSIISTTQIQNFTSYNTFDSEVDIIVGKDVHNIDYKIRRHNSFPSGVLVNLFGSIRIDRLILLNLASKLIKALP